MKELEVLTVKLITVHDGIFKPLDPINPSRAICGALIAQEAFILEHVLTHRLGKSSESQRLRKQKSNALNRALKKSEENEQDIPEELQLPDDDLFNREEQPSKKKSVTDRAKNSLTKGVRALKNSARDAQKSLAKVGRKKRTFMKTEIQMQLLGVDFGDQDEVSKIIRDYSQDKFEPNTLSDRLILVADALHILGEACAKDANSFFRRINGKDKGREIEFKTEKVGGRESLRNIEDMEKFHAQMEKCLTSLDQLVQVHNRVVAEEYGSVVPEVETGRSFIQYFRALNLARVTINPFRSSNLGIIGAYDRADRLTAQKNRKTSTDESLYETLVYGSDDASGLKLWETCANIFCDATKVQDKEKWIAEARSFNSGLHDAVAKDDIEKCRHILKNSKHSYVNRKGDKGNAALHIAVNNYKQKRQNAVDIIELLVTAQADPSRQNYELETPLYLANGDHLLTALLAPQ